MSQPAMQSVTCPACGSVQEFAVFDTVNAAERPELRQKLLSRELVTFVCGACGKQTQVGFDLLYHDPGRRVILWLIHDPDEMPPAPPGAVATPAYRRRLVRSVNDLIEKIVAFEAGLDDRLLEVFKLALLGSLMADGATAGGQLLFAGMGGDQMMFVLLSPGNTQQFAVSQAGQYEPFARQFAGKVPPLGEGWTMVDAAWALDVMKG